MYSKICIIHVIPPPPPPICFFRWIPHRNISPSSQECSFVPIIFSCIYSKSLFEIYKIIDMLWVLLFINKSLQDYFTNNFKNTYFKYYLHPVLYFCKDLRWRVILGWMIKLGWTKQKQTSFCYVQIIKGGKWMVETSLYRTPLMSELRCVRRV